MQKESVARETEQGKTLYSPIGMDAMFKRFLEELGWEEKRNTFWVTDDEKLLHSIHDEDKAAQKQATTRLWEKADHELQPDWLREESRRRRGLIRQMCFCGCGPRSVRHVACNVSSQPSNFAFIADKVSARLLPSGSAKAAALA